MCGCEKHISLVMEVGSAGITCSNSLQIYFNNHADQSYIDYYRHILYCSVSFYF